MSKLVIYFVAAVFLVSKEAVGDMYRIIQGRIAYAEEFPYLATFERKKKHWCGASIVDDHWLLTAAHCVNQDKTLTEFPDLIVRVGHNFTGEGGEVYEISKVLLHEKYDDSAKMDQYDIALVKLKHPLKFGNSVKTVEMATETPAEGELGWVSGFGRQEIMRSANEKRQLNTVQLPVVSLKRCRELISNVADDMICAGHKTGNRDACTGDSGGPYVVGDKLVGIVAWGLGCGREGLPGVYTNVAYYKDWIKSTMKK